MRFTIKISFLNFVTFCIYSHKTKQNVPTVTQRAARSETAAAGFGLSLEVWHIC